MVDKFFRLSIISGIFFLCAGSLIAQSPQELRLGAWVSGILNEGEEHWFSVKPSGAGYIIVETDGDTDTFLTAYRASRNYSSENDYISENDDYNEEDYNARLDIYAEAGNTYLFKLNCYNEEESGPYRIRANFESIPSDTERNTELSKAVQIKLGEAIPVYLRSPDESRWYRYEITRGETVFAVQTRGAADTILFMYDSKGNIITEDDDSGEEDGNAFIMQKLKPGIIYIEVKQYEGLVSRCTLHAETR